MPDKKKKPKAQAKPNDAAPAAKKASGKKSKESSEVQRLKAQLAAAEAALLVKRTSDMLDDEEEQEVRAKKKTKTTRQVTDVPDSSDEDIPEFGKDDTAEMDGLLGAERRILNTQDKSKDATEDESATSDSTDKDKNSDGSGPDDDHKDDESGDDLRPAHGEELVVQNTGTKSKARTTSRRSKPRTSTSSTETSSSSKVKLSNFSPQSLRLANAGRYAVRVGIATKKAFPLEHRDWTWRTVESAVVAADDASLTERLNVTKDDADRRANLVSYAWGGAAQLRGEVKILCKAVVLLFGIPGAHSPEQIVKIIEWLINPKKGIFKYGGIDIATRTYDKQKPFGHPFYQDVITKQFFSSQSSEGVRQISMEDFINLNLPVLGLITDGMENSLQEYATGVRVRIKFTAEEYASRYDYHLATLEKLQQRSPTWFAAFQRNLYSVIVYVACCDITRCSFVLNSNSTTFNHLKAIVNQQEDSDDEDIDFSALEASVVKAAPQPMTSTQ
ncbi:hypothetical protein C8R44DRAFT_251291 [Mycena epipterygia]|nr:hypothetical protein C8R44DRAFT_251291 [Mycena epipterygia]